MRQNKKIVFSDDGSSTSKRSDGVPNNGDSNYVKHISKEDRQSRWKQNAKKNGPKTVYYNGDSAGDSDQDNYSGDGKRVSGFRRNYKHADILKLKMKARTLLDGRKKLPVFKVKDELMKQLMEHRVSVVIGETGSGKSTQIPQFLMKQIKGKIAVTQPRRVAAINLATRVSEEFGCDVGRDVGYAVRFNNATSYKTMLKYMTDGMLLREMMLDPLLSDYSAVIVDEAHERTILTDMILGFLKELLVRKRKDDKNFRVIVMSATLDADKFSAFFNKAPIFFIEGRLFHVDRYYLPHSVDDIIDSMVKSIIQVNQEQTKGDVLCFLPGQEDIDKVTSILHQIAPALPREAPMIVPLPLYAALPPQQQLKVFDKVKPHQRKVILSTNIAETSVTIPGVRYVIDSGLRKIKVWRHELGLSTLLTVPISKASASQRTGRAGREAPGKCFRLYTENDYIKLSQNTEPEIIRSEIVYPVLMLKRLGVDDILNWFWLENPAALCIECLIRLGEDHRSWRANGSLPVTPHLGAVLIQASKFGVLSTVMDIVACLSVDNLILTPPSEQRDVINAKRRETCTLGDRYGDLVMLKELFNIYNDISSSDERRIWCKSLGVSYKGFKNVLRIRKQISQYMDSMDGRKNEKERHSGVEDGNKSKNDDSNEDEIKTSVPLNYELVLKSFLKGFITNTAIGMPDRSYRTVTSGDTISIHPSSLLFGKKIDAVMYIEHVYTMKGYARNVSAIKTDWLREMAPHLLGSRVKVEK
ncbi:hypothetical protein HII12_002253 [Brettanomyces bruxellensis]|uniref:RNA helicase n=1 Tax=Dekkera bruxellensis TaxID=5007 RepID=A0A8H6BJC8_DEKBR|nr:hypothetical protein HII12_002253 [Brettanomyces bruxellensis]